MIGRALQHRTAIAWTRRWPPWLRRWSVERRQQHPRQAAFSPGRGWAAL